MSAIKASIILILCSLFSFGQNRASQLYFGDCIIDFSKPEIEVINSGLKMQSFESYASICDEAGNLICFSNGGDYSIKEEDSYGGIWNSDYELIENAELFDSGGCYSSSRGAILLPVPNHNPKTKNKFYLITHDCSETNHLNEGHNSGLTYALIDMNENNGKGKVIEKYKTIIPYSESGNLNVNSSQETVAITQHPNKKDYWIFSVSNDSICSILLTENGFSPPRRYHQLRGAVMLSPNGKYLFAQHQIWEVDLINGNLTLKHTLPHTREHPYFQPEFSPNGKLLYCKSEDGSSLYQYNIEASDFIASRVKITSFENSFDTNYGDLFLAPNQKIYIYRNSHNSFTGVIQCPNSIGLACAYDPTNISIGGGTFKHGAPNVVSNYLYFDSPNECSNGLNETFKDLINFSFNNQEIKIQSSKNQLSVSIYDTHGKIMLTKKTNSTDFSISLQEIPSGIYFARIQNQKASKSFKFVISR